MIGSSLVHGDSCSDVMGHRNYIIVRLDSLAFSFSFEFN